MLIPPLVLSSVLPNVHHPWATLPLFPPGRVGWGGHAQKSFCDVMIPSCRAHNICVKGTAKCKSKLAYISRLECREYKYTTRCSSSCLLKQSKCQKQENTFLWHHECWRANHVIGGACLSFSETSTGAGGTCMCKIKGRGNICSSCALKKTQASARKCYKIGCRSSRDRLCFSLDFVEMFCLTCRWNQNMHACGWTQEPTVPATPSAYICNSQWQNQEMQSAWIETADKWISNYERIIYTCPLATRLGNALLGPSSSIFKRRGLMANFVWMPPYEGGVRKTLSDWLTIFAKKVNANEDRLSKSGLSMLWVLCGILLNVTHTYTLKCNENGRDKGQL